MDYTAVFSHFQVLQECTLVPSQGQPAYLLINQDQQELRIRQIKSSYAITDEGLSDSPLGNDGRSSNFSR